MANYDGEREAILDDWGHAIRDNLDVVAQKRFELQRDFRAEVEKVCGKPSERCTAAEINAVWDSLPDEWWERHRQKPAVDFMKPVPRVQQVLPF